MPLLNDQHAIAAHVRAAVDDGDRWLFLTDTPEIAKFLAALGIAVTCSGVPASELGWASFTHLVATTGVRTDVNILTVPKARFTRPEVIRFMTRLGASVSSLPSDVDIFPLGQNPELLGGILQSILTSKTYGIQDPVRN